MKAKENSTPAKKMTQKELLAKALGKDVKDVTTVEELVADVPELYAKAKAKIKNDASFVDEKKSKTANQILDEVEADIIDKENAPDNSDEIEIEEVEVPKKGKKVIPQNSVQAQKILAKAKATEPTEEEIKAARRKEISAKALAAKRAKKAAAEAEASKPAAKPKATTPAPTKHVDVNKTLAFIEKYVNHKDEPVARTRTPKPVNEKRIQLNKLLVEHKGMTLDKIEESTGKLNDKMVDELLLKMNETATPEPKAKPKSEPVTRTKTNNTTPLSKMTVAQLNEMKGKISDVQLNKYLKIASKRDGVELAQAAPTKSAPEPKATEVTRTRTRTVAVEKPESVKLTKTEELAQLAMELYVALKRFERYFEATSK